MNFSAPSQKPDVTLSLSLQPSLTPFDGLKSQERSVELIQLLLACANHASSGNLHHADTCLHKISQLSSTSGDAMQRLAARFAAALAARIVKRWPGLYKALTNSTQVRYDLGAAHPHVHAHPHARARSIFNKVFPYMEFVHAIISRTLIQTLKMECMIHVIDLGCSDIKLWAPFLRGVSDGGANGPPSVKITCVSRDKECQERLGNKLVKEANSLNMTLYFNPLNVTLEELTIEMLNIQPSEALALISILGLHVLLAEDDRHFGLDNKRDEIRECKKMNEFLGLVKSMGSKVVLLVEQESNHNSSRLSDRFVEGLHFYSALFDSIDVAFQGSSSEDRTALEDMFGQEIEDVVACEGLERKERHERFAKWAVIFGRLGFRPVRLWYDCMEEAQRSVKTFGPNGFNIVSQKGSLMICWHDRPIYAVSGWICFG